jgi:large subunit ribosomal protein L6
MSKIGRMPITIGNVTIELKGRELHYKGNKASGVHEIPDILDFKHEDSKLFVVPSKQTKDLNRLWGLHRALIANKLKGADVGFEKQLRIVGLGYKAVATGSKMQFSLGYSHKIDYELPEHVTVEVDKSGQILKLKCFDKQLLGQVCSYIRSLRPPEPYKGTGIRYEDEVIIRKAGKTK